jgi:hypothetical protein
MATKTTLGTHVITSFPSVPLTTTFTRPPGSACGGIYGPAKVNVFIIDDEPSCLPSGFSTSNSAFFFSPGVACPEGYWTACYDTTGVASITTVTCCPTYGAISLSCVPNPLKLRAQYETLFCTWRAPPSPGADVRVTKSDDGRTRFVMEHMTDPQGINAYGVRMVHQATDLLPPSSSSSASSSASSTASPPPDNTSPPGSDNGDSDNGSADSESGSSGGLSTGTKAAIGAGVAVPLTVLALCLAFFFFWRRRRQQQQQQQPPSPAGPEVATTHEGGVPYQQQQQQQLGVGGYRYYGDEKAEMPGGWVPPELPSVRRAAEMPGGWVTPELPSTRAAVELPGASVGGGPIYHHEAPS